MRVLKPLKHIEHVVKPRVKQQKKEAMARTAAMAIERGMQLLCDSLQSSLFTRTRSESYTYVYPGTQCTALIYMVQRIFARAGIDVLNTI